jgi:disulfide oxidoreductase YuzD
LKRLKLIQATILDDSHSQKCEGRCGMDLSSPRQLKTMASLLKKIYGESVQLKYHNLGTSSVEDSPLAIAEQASLDELRLPLLLINGKPRISGYFGLRLMQDVIQAEMEIGS